MIPTDEARRTEKGIPGLNSMLTPTRRPIRSVRWTYRFVTSELRTFPPF